MQPYRPEGTTAPVPSLDALHRGPETQEVFRALCVKSDEYRNLHVDLGSIRGVVPRDEVSAGASGTYALLSRVGKPISFQVMNFLPDGTAMLSRRSAQLDARNYFLNTLIPGDIVSACVVSTTSFGVFCDLGCGFTALMPISRCCISRLKDGKDRYQSGAFLSAAVLDIDEDQGRIVLSGRETLGTWDENAAQFRQGETVPGIVRSIMPYGIFVELTPNLSGLAEPVDGLQEGEPVSVYLRAILPSRHKIKLNILEKLPCPLPPRKPEYFITSGHLSSWSYFPGSKAATYFGSSHEKRQPSR